MNTIRKVLVIVVTIVGLVPISAHAETVENPILVVDKCPEFCPPGIKGPTWPILVVDKCPEFCPKPTTPLKPTKPLKTLKPSKPTTPPVQMCTQALIPVPNRPGYWYTDGCMKKIIGPVNGNGLLGKVPFKK